MRLIVFVTLKILTQMTTIIVITMMIDSNPFLSLYHQKVSSSVMNRVQRAIYFIPFPSKVYPIDFEPSYESFLSVYL